MTLGEILNEEYLIPMGISRRELSDYLNVQVHLINSIIYDDHHIDEETCNKLDKFFKQSEGFWYKIHTECESRSKVDIDILIDQVLQWGLDKGITGENGKATLLSQLSKTQEELDETLTAARNNDLTEIIDGIGDCAVTLILASERAGVDFRDCLQAAYNEIKGRKGAMIDGLFVKEN